MGPRAIQFTANGAAALKPVQLVDNPDTWLDFTDLVFVDPVGTGYSRTTAGTDEADRAFYGVDKDADAMASFVQLYLTRTGRELSQVFLAGESYGGFRCILLADRLLRAGVAVRGLALISPAIEFSMLRGDRYALLPLALTLPSIAAAHFQMRDGIRQLWMACGRLSSSQALRTSATSFRGSGPAPRSMTNWPATPVFLRS
jgi:carboxypeptidase C (cathepsin A)